MKNFEHYLKESAILKPFLASLVEDENLTEEIAVNLRTALKMFWDAGYDTEGMLKSANAMILAAPQVAKGYWKASDISKIISGDKKNLK